MKELAQRVDYWGTYSRCNNLRLVNIPENAEGTDIKGFTSSLLESILQLPEVQSSPDVDRVQCGMTAINHG